MRSLPLAGALALALAAACGGSSKHAVNDPCTANTDCADDICHDGICASSHPLAAGGTCTGDGDCLTFNCEAAADTGGRRCGPGVATDGVVCLHAEECLDGTCENGTCGGVAPGPLDGTWTLTGKICNGSPVDLSGSSTTTLIVTGSSGRIVNSACTIPITLTYPDATTVDWVMGNNSCGGIGDEHTATYAISGRTLTLDEAVTPLDEYGCPSGHQVSTFTGGSGG